MITDNERREVAERMRGYDISEFKESAIVPFLDCLGVGYLNWREILDSLADLIDRETCEMAECSIDHGSRLWGMRCSRCGTEFEHEKPVYGWRYCPKCGAEVIDD